MLFFFSSFFLSCTDSDPVALSALHSMQSVCSPSLGAHSSEERSPRSQSITIPTRPLGTAAAAPQGSHPKQKIYIYKKTQKQEKSQEPTVRVVASKTREKNGMYPHRGGQGVGQGWLCHCRAAAAAIPMHGCAAAPQPRSAGCRWEQPPATPAAGPCRALLHCSLHHLLLISATTSC